MTLKLSWHGQEEFASQPLRGWNVTSDFGDLRTYEAGLTRSAGPLTFATVHGGGHMVCVSGFLSHLLDERPDADSVLLNTCQTPYDRPLESLELIKRWLVGEDL